MRRLSATVVLTLLAGVFLTSGGAAASPGAPATSVKVCKRRLHGKVTKTACAKPNAKPKWKKHVPSPPPAPTTTTTPTPVQGTTRANPIPLGTSAPITVLGSNGWSLVVDSVVPDDTAAVLAANMFNDPPAEGHQFFLISITATYNGTGTSNGFAVESALNAVGASNVSYTLGSEDSCGVLPDPDFGLVNDAKTVFAGGSISGNICFSVTNADAVTLELFVNDQSLTGAAQTWFALR